MMKRLTTDMAEAAVEAIECVTHDEYLGDVKKWLAMVKSSGRLESSMAAANEILGGGNDLSKVALASYFMFRAGWHARDAEEAEQAQRLAG